MASRIGVELMGYPTIVNGVSALMTQEDVDAYRELVSTIPAGGTLVEIGSYEGGSLAAVSDIIKVKKIQVVAVDEIFKQVKTWKGSCVWAVQK